MMDNGGAAASASRLIKVPSASGAVCVGVSQVHVLGSKKLTVGGSARVVGGGVVVVNGWGLCDSLELVLATVDLTCGGVFSTAQGKRGFSPKYRQVSRSGPVNLHDFQPFRLVQELLMGEKFGGR